MIFREVVEVAKRGRIVKDPPKRGRFQKETVRGAAKYAIFGPENDNYEGREASVHGKKRDTVTYELRDGRKVVYRGVTGDPERRAAQHRVDGKKFTKVVVTSRKMTREGAEKKEAELLEIYRRNHSGQLPKYNEKDTG